MKMYEFYLHFPSTDEWKLGGTFLASLAEEMMDACREMCVNPEIGCDKVNFVDPANGNAVWSVESVDDDEDYDYDDCDYEVGYDPYLGCFTDDC